MRIAELIIVSCILVVSGAGAASAQFVEPLRVLELSRRDRLEMDKRLAREAAAQRQKEKADQAAQADTQRKLDKEKATAASGAPTPDTPPAQLEVSPAASPASAASGTPDASQPLAPSTRDETALASSSAADPANGAPFFSQPGASSGAEIVSGAPTPTAPASRATSETPAANQPLASPAQETVVGAPAPTPIRVLITVDKAAQRMRVTVDGKLRHSWPVSTGRVQFETPSGTFRPLRLAKEHYSKEWDDAPMPHSIFFTSAGHAIHGSNATRRLGRPASHGCVRLAPANAAKLFALVKAEGLSNTKVVVTGGQVGRVARRQTPQARPPRLRAVPERT